MEEKFKYEKWESFFREREKLGEVNYGRDKKVISLRIPKELYNFIYDDLYILHKNDLETTVTDYILLSIMLQTRVIINDQGEYSRSKKRNDVNLTDYLKIKEKEEKNKEQKD